MLLRNVVLLVDIALERGEDVTLVEEKVSASALNIQQGIVRDATRVRRRFAVFGWDGEVLKLFTEDDDRLFREEGILRLGGTKVGRWRPAFYEMLLCGEEAGRAWCSIEILRGLSEEGENV